MPNQPSFGGRANNLLSSVEHTAPLVMTGKTFLSLLSHTMILSTKCTSLNNILQ